MERIVLERPKSNSRVMLIPETAAIVCKKLFDYEDTGLTPEQISLREDDIKLASRENKEYREEILKLRKELEDYRNTGLTPEKIIKQQKIIELKSNCFNQIKAKFEQLLKMYEAGCDGYVGLWRELLEYQEAEEQGLLIKRDCTGCKRIIYNNGDCNICARKAADFYEK